MAKKRGQRAVQAELELPSSAPEPDARLAPEISARLLVTLDLIEAAIRFDWLATSDETTVLARGAATCHSQPHWPLATYDWLLEDLALPNRTSRGHLTARAASSNAFILRVRDWLPVESKDIAIKLRLPAEVREHATSIGVSLPPDPWAWLQKELLNVLVQAEEQRGSAVRDAIDWRTRTAVSWLGSRIPESLQHHLPAPSVAGHTRLRVRVNEAEPFVELIWFNFLRETPLARVHFRPARPGHLEWVLESDGVTQRDTIQSLRSQIRSLLDAWNIKFPAPARLARLERVQLDPYGNGVTASEVGFAGEAPSTIIENAVLRLADGTAHSRAARDPTRSPPRPSPQIEAEEVARHWRQREAERRNAEAAMRVRAREQLEQQEQKRADRERRRQAAAAVKDAATPLAPSSPPEPLPPIPVQIDPLDTQYQLSLLPLSTLDGWFLRERAAQWWVSNQTDDLLALPFCRIQHLEYQIRTALRVIGPLRGRALLSDEVGLGKTIEAGLVLREYVTRGMVRRFLVVTQPSLVDQWAEELSDKFGLETITTNDAARGDPERFWRESPGIVASLHTLKQPAHLAVARHVPWDLLIVDEAHHLRNPNSQAWQAVNVIPRQFLLLLTATPVQNSLEELYHLVTLLQPGQLPSPKEFRSRFIDPRRPRQPREPEELRRLLQQVMIRNTRSNAGIQLPARRAHTVLFRTSEAEGRFWKDWQNEFRDALTRLPAAQASLWGRLLLQAAGSSPAAWREALARFPDAAAALRWRESAVLDEGWRAKCQLLPPLAKQEGGVVVFTQFLATQYAIAEALRSERVPVTVINGETPAAQRQSLTDAFRHQGGALLLSRSGTEGRNLQFSSCLVNFDLPWNPMEIEQRIGRLHRLGQTRPVHIHNFVAEDTLQFHLLELLQEKLNLFELVVGETGLILGDRFSSDEFATEILQCWRAAEADDGVRAAFEQLGDALTTARESYDDTRRLDATLFARDYESE
ncbi:MAG: DEAD/DEAH box helicase [Verrucomicrobiales bacterium]|nr:DEAD/DEAH box helicase [Verrucomicrobiales bacterium]